MAIPLLEAIDIEGKEVSADALLTQRKLADCLVRERKAHYHFTVKGNQPGILQDLELYFQNRGKPHFVEHTPPITDASKPARSGPLPNSTTTSTFLTWDKLSSSSGIVSRKRPVRLPEKSPTASPAEPSNKLTRNAFSRSTAGTGRSRTVATTFSTGTMMKTAVASVPATARKTSPGFAASLSA